MTSKEVRNYVMEFWNSGIPGKEVTEIKGRDTIMRAVLDLELVHKVIAIKRKVEGEDRLFLVNLQVTKEAEEKELAKET